MQTSIFLECTQCQRRNYLTTKNRKNTEGKLELKKYCRHCRKHVVHKETKV